MLLLGFGSAARRGSTGWTDAARLRAVIDACQPDETGDGASPSRGADELFHWASQDHFEARGLDPKRARRCPYDPAIDGPIPGGFFRRNARQYRLFRPALSVSGILGPVGSPLTSGSRHMAEVCRAGGTPTLVLRDNGIEPDPTPLDTLRALYRLTNEPALVPAGLAVAAWAKGRAEAGPVVAALRCAAESAPRWAPWVAAVIAALDQRGNAP